MKKSYKKIIKQNNAISAAAPTSVWGYKGCAGKGGKTTNHAIQESMFQRELREMNKT